MIYIELIFLIIPLMIILNIRSANTVKGKKIRIKYAIPSCIMIFIYLIFLFLEIRYKISNYISDLSIYIIPFLLDIVCVIFYNSSKEKEKIVILDDLSKELENSRLNKQKGRVSINIETDEIEKL